jgi:hypothetical protein
LALASLRSLVSRTCSTCPTHFALIARHCFSLVAPFVQVFYPAAFVVRPVGRGVEFASSGSLEAAVLLV